MNIKLYNTTSPRNKVTKTLSLVADINGEPHDIVSETEMSVRLTTGHLQGVQGSNYCYIADTGKYYYISPNYQIDNQSVVVYLKEDVLMSLRTELLQQTCTVAKNEFLSDAYLYDDNYKIDAFSNIVTKEFPQGFSGESMVLLTTG